MRLSVLIVMVLTLTAAVSINDVQAGSKSSGNEAVEKIKQGLELKGMTKAEVAEEIGEPWQKDTTPEKARVDEKWIYSCETDKGLTYDCLYVYFMGGKVKNVGTMFDSPNEY